MINNNNDHSNNDSNVIYCSLDPPLHLHPIYDAYIMWNSGLPQLALRSSICVDPAARPTMLPCLGLGSSSTPCSRRIGHSLEVENILFDEDLDHQKKNMFQHNSCEYNMEYMFLLGIHIWWENAWNMDVSLRID